MKKRILSFCIAVAMALVLLPEMATAAEYFGTLGSSISWEFEPDNGTLTVEGKGEIPTFSGTYPERRIPWYIYKQEITTIYVGEGITHLGRFSFNNCKNLTEVHLPSTLHELSSFRTCSSLTHVDLPNGLTEIGMSAFYGTNVKEIVIPESVTKIAGEGLYSCDTIYFLGNAPELDVIYMGGVAASNG